MTDDRFLTRAEVEQRFSIARSTIYRLMRAPAVTIPVADPHRTACCALARGRPGRLGSPAGPTPAAKPNARRGDVDEVNACDELARRILDALPDAQLVACGPDKRAVQAGWPALYPTADDLKGAALVGVIPASVGLVVVDVDTDGMPTYTAAEMTRRRESVEQALGEPLATCPTPSGGGHMHYRAQDGEVRNRKWLHGDVRGSRGYVIAWDVDALLHAAGAADMATAPDLGALPTPRHVHSRREAHRAGRHQGGDRGRTKRSALPADLRRGGVRGP